jgi:2-hydroxychromene-2-carboxylate isomerase
MSARPRIEFYFDYGSPFSYLADTQVAGVAKRTGADLVYRPMLLGGIFKATGGASPATIPAKAAYMNVELRRWAARYGVPFGGNPHFPINTLPLMRGAIAAEHAGCFPAYHAAIFPAFWADGLDLGREEVVREVLAGAGLDEKDIVGHAADPEVKEGLKAATEDAVRRGVFGAPTFFVGDEMFWGNDRLILVEEMLGAR